MTVPSAAEERLARLRVFIEQDPENPSLVQEAASAALDAGRPSAALELLREHAKHGPRSPELYNLEGLARLNSGAPGDAASIFRELLAVAPDDAGLRYNLAFALAMLRDWRGALDALDGRTVEASADAATLQVQALHHLEELEEALSRGETLLACHPGHEPLASALAVAAMDADRPDLAERYGALAPHTHEGLATLGMLQLEASSLEHASELFDRALEANPQSARAHLGRGLVTLLDGDAGEAALSLDRGADIFKDHIGSWIAAGWAHLVNGDRVEGRRRFERALALDDNFAESHGALAVLDVLEGDVATARRRCEIALRLDAQCLSAVLAKSLLATQDGRPEAAERILQSAISTPLEPGGRTISQFMAELLRKSPKG